MGDGFGYEYWEVAGTCRFVKVPNRNLALRCGQVWGDFFAQNAKLPRLPRSCTGRSLGGASPLASCPHEFLVLRTIGPIALIQPSAAAASLCVLEDFFALRAPCTIVDLDAISCACAHDLSSSSHLNLLCV